MYMKRVVAQCISTLLLPLFLGMMFLSLFHMSTSMTEHGMFDCLFMHHEESLCHMTFDEHLGAWESAFLSLPIVLLIFTLVLIRFFTPVFFNFFQYILRVYLGAREKYRSKTLFVSYSFLRELFSQGILHPKLFA